MAPNEQAGLPLSPPGSSDAGPEVLSSAGQQAGSQSPVLHPPAMVWHTHPHDRQIPLKTRSESGALCQPQLEGWEVGGRGRAMQISTESKWRHLTFVPTCAADTAVGVTLKIKYWPANDFRSLGPFRDPGNALSGLDKTLWIACYRHELQVQFGPWRMGMKREKGSAKTGRVTCFFHLLIAAAKREGIITVQGFTDLFLICPHNSLMG